MQQLPCMLSQGYDGVLSCNPMPHTVVYSNCLYFMSLAMNRDLEVIRPEVDIIQLRFLHFESFIYYKVWLPITYE